MSLQSGKPPPSYLQTVVLYTHPLPKSRSTRTALALPGWGETDSNSDTDTPEFGLFTCLVHEIYAQPAVTQKLIDVAHRCG
jgi:HK97 family phage major capsid protein